MTHDDVGMFSCLVRVSFESAVDAFGMFFVSLVS